MYHRHALVLAAAVLFVVSSVGCDAGSDPSQRIVGNWELSKDHLKKAMEAELKNKAGDGAGTGAAFGSAMMESMLSQMEMKFDFHQDGKLIFSASLMGKDNSDEGTWEFVSSTADTVTLKIGMQGKESEPATIKFIDDNTIEISPPNTQGGAAPGLAKIVMTRVI